jgi:tRNA G46 methylase TrmB
VHYRSRPVDSGQDDIHPHLLKTLETHLHSEYKKPISVYSHTLFATVENIRMQLDLPVILDSGCGTGASTLSLALRYPNALVIGVDKSSHRLALGGIHEDLRQESNSLILKMELVDFWRLAVRHSWHLQKHYILYPNPWPKPKLLKRRWHAHPVFPDLLRLGGELELRCNWRIYAEEFRRAINYITPNIAHLDEYIAKAPISLFEKKYTESGHILYRCLCALDNLVINTHYSGGSEPVVPVTSLI